MVSSISNGVKSRISADDVPSVIRSQLIADPQLPRTTPTASSWQIPTHQSVGAIRSPDLPLKADFAVIGSGIAACGVTRSLLSNCLSANKTVVVLEARGLCSGATGRNGGQLTRLPPTRHEFMVKEFGVEQANKVMRLTVRGLNEMHKLAESRGPKFLEETKKTRLEKFFAYYDEESWKEAIEAIKLYEKEVPEDKGAYQLVSKEDTAKVSSICALFPSYGC